jgi:hypothetical protein
MCNTSDELEILSSTTPFLGNLKFRVDSCGTLIKCQSAERRWSVTSGFFDSLHSDLSDLFNLTHARDSILIPCRGQHHGCGTTTQRVDFSC